MDEHKYKEDPETREIKSEIAQEKPRDNEGHFVHIEPPKPGEQPHQNPISKFLSDHSHYDKTQDDLLDVHIGNPLRKIYLVLQDIKNQKVLSISAKMSFGIMGVAVVIGIFSIFGVSNIFCSKGVQTEIGVIKVLNARQKAPSTIPFLGTVINWFNKIPNFPNNPNPLPNRTVLVKSDDTTVFLPYSQNVNVSEYQNITVSATGNYDACNSTLTLANQSNIEVFIGK